MPRKQRTSPVAPIAAPRVDDERIVPLVPPVKKAAPTSPAPPSTKSAVKKPHRRTTPLVEDATSPRTIARRHIEEILAIWGVTLSKAQKRSAIDHLIRLANKPVNEVQLDAIQSHEVASALPPSTLPPPMPVIARLHLLRRELADVISLLTY